MREKIKADWVFLDTWTEVKDVSLTSEHLKLLRWFAGLISEHDFMFDRPLTDAEFAIVERLSNVLSD